MSALAFILVVTAALLHATWNYLLKKSGGGIGVLTLSAIFAASILTPFALVLIGRGSTLQSLHLGIIIGSGLIHTGYFLLLDRAYRSGGDLSVVYPLARATGPLLTIVAATLWLGERMTPLATCGALLIGVSAFLLTGNPATFWRHAAQHSIGFALLTGCMIAGYTLWDKQAVAAFLIPPIVFDWGANLSRIAILAPLARLREPGALTRTWREQRQIALIIGALSSFSYILVLYTMTFTPVSYVAPARELSILFVALLGAHALKEGEVTRRSIAALGMVLGIAGLTLG